MPLGKLEKKADERGWLAEILKANDLKNKTFGQIFITVAKPGITKGGHYHTRKREYFCVVKGSGILTLKTLDENRKVVSTEEIEMGEDNLRTIELEPMVYHTIKNIGDEDFYLLAYTDEVFDPKDTDTFSDIIE